MTAKKRNDNGKKDGKGSKKGQQARANFEALLHEIKRREAESPIDTYVPLEGQRDFHADRATIRLLLGGNRAGKTTAGACELIWMALERHPYTGDMFKGRKHRGPKIFWFVSRTFELLREITQREILKWLPRGEIKPSGIKYRHHGIIDYIELNNGNRIVGKAVAAGLDAFKGVSCHGIWQDEEPTPNGEQIFSECVARAAAVGGRIWITMTPDYGVSWTYTRIFKSPKAFIHGQTKPELAKSKEYHVFSIATENNVHNEKTIIEDIKSGITDEVQLRTKLFGEYTVQTGLIFKEFDANASVIAEPKLSVHYDYFVGIDTGRHFAAELAFIDFYGNIIVFDEFYGMDIVFPDCIRAVKAKLMDRGISLAQTTFFIDPSSQFKQEMWEAGLPAYNANNDVLDGIHLMRMAMRVNPGKKVSRTLKNPRFYIVGDNCPWLLWEIDRYIWDEWRGDRRFTKDPKSTPRKKDDHAIDAVRYIIASRADASSRVYDDIPMDPYMTPIERFNQKVKNRIQANQERLNNPEGEFDSFYD